MRTRELRRTCQQGRARSEDGTVMAVRRLDRPTHGVQFHPESVLTPEGPALLAAFLALGAAA